MDYNSCVEKLNKYGQNHLLAHYNSLSNFDKKILLDEISKVNFDLIEDLYKNKILKGINSKNFDLNPIVPLVLDNLGIDEIKELNNIGLSAISKNNVAVLLIAGGQGTRLGYEGPKGAFNLGLGDDTTLFKMQATDIKKLSLENNAQIPWYIMTSPQNHNETMDYFEKNNYFALDKKDIIFFKQEQMPSIDKEGKILLKSKCELSLNPNGHGGCISALRNYKLLDDMNNRGIKYIFFSSVDNYKAKMADPILLGACIKNDVDIAAKCIKKSNPEEKVGVFAYKNNVPSIVEYTELSDSHKYQIDAHDKNELAYRCANINAFVFKLDFLEKALAGQEEYHIAYKKIPYLNEDGQTAMPEKENGYKFESLYFDYFDFAKNMYLIEVKREDEFAPIKNLKGVDSLESALKYTLFDEIL